MTVIIRRAFYEKMLRGGEEVIKTLPYFYLHTNLGEMYEPMDGGVSPGYLGTPFFQKDVHEFSGDTGKRGRCAVTGTALHAFTNDPL
jgi:hypothetical protein